METMRQNSTMRIAMKGVLSLPSTNRNKNMHHNYFFLFNYKKYMYISISNVKRVIFVVLKFFMDQFKKV